MDMFGQKGRNEEEGQSGDEPGVLPPWASFFQSSDRYERFEREVRQYFRGRGVSALIEDGVVRGPGLGAMQCGLTNLGQLCAQSEEAEWPRLVTQHFDNLLAAGAPATTPLNLEEARAQLGVRLFRESDIADVFDVAIVREDVPGLISTLCLDLPATVQTVRRDQIEHWKLSDDELFAMAGENLSNLIDLDPEQVDVHGAKLWFAGGESFFNSSALLCLDDYPEFAGKHGMFVSAPTRHVVLALPFDSVEAMNDVAQLMGLTAHLAHEGPGSLSTLVWWHKDGRWIEIPWDFTDEGIRVDAPEAFIEVLEEIAASDEQA